MAVFSEGLLVRAAGACEGEEDDPRKVGGAPGVGDDEAADA